MYPLKSKRQYNRIMKHSDRRNFIKKSTIAGLGLGLGGSVSLIYGKTHKKNERLVAMVHVPR